MSQFILTTILMSFYEETELEEAEKLVQGHSTGKWPSGNLNPGLPNPKLP